MWTGDAHRPFLHDPHFNAAWSFQIDVSRGKRGTDIRPEWQRLSANASGGVNQTLAGNSTMCGSLRRSNPEPRSLWGQ
jgi:hypothetical protein